MRRTRFLAGVTALATLGITGLTTLPAQASSHREAPLISQDPTADNTDLYTFKDPNDANYVVIIANYIGLEQPAAGPNFSRFGDDVLYEIHVDNNGDVADDIVYQFRFRTETVSGDTFLYNTNRINAPNDANQNVRQFYSVRRIDKNGSTMLGTDLPTPPVNIGPRSTPNYEAALAAPTVASLPGTVSTFAGQRDDPFFVDLGSVFDLLGLRPLNSAHAYPMTNAPGVDGLNKKNVHSIAIRIPVSQLSKNGDTPTTMDSKDSVIGVWASASRQRVRVLDLGGGAPRNAGRWVQVSRLGIPLVNEVLIPLKHKDDWNSGQPKDDAEYFPNILDPEPAKLIPVLYPGVSTPPGGFNSDGSPKRGDIVAVLSGAGAGLSAANYLPPADMLRLNLATPNDPNPPDRLAILAGDSFGFPNGRRLVDDVVDIELRLLAGGTPFTPAYNHSPNNALTDGVDANEYPFLSTFPFEATPTSGYDQP